MKSGVYQIVCRATGERYIGSSNNIPVRFAKHRYKLGLGSHDNYRLQSAWNLYGKEQFHFGVIVYCDSEDLRIKEQNYMDVMNPSFNICPSAFGSTGVKRRQKTKDAVRIAKLGTGKGYCFHKRDKCWQAAVNIGPNKQKTFRFSIESDAINFIAKYREDISK
jgi:group I intron endonuclease